MDIIPSENLNIFDNVISNLQLLQSKYDTNIITINNKLQEVYDENFIFKNKIKELSDTLENVTNENNIIKLESNKIIKNNILLLKECENNQYTINLLNNDIEKYKAQIKTSEDDHKEFTKVSHVIMLEKENNKLRIECELLKNKSKLVSLAEKERKENKKECSTRHRNNKNIKPIDNNFNIIDQQIDNKLNIIKIPEKLIEENHLEIPEKLIEANHIEIAEKLIEENPIEIPEQLESISIEEEEDIDVYEKKIKGIIYYISSNDDMKIYQKNSNGTIGIQLGFLEKIGEKRKIKWIIH